MKKLLLVFISFLTIISLNAQEQGKFRGGFNLGAGLPSKGGGLTGDVDFRYNIKDNINIGVKFGFGILVRDVTDNSSIASIASHSMVISDYYFNKSGATMFSPFLGGGVGSYTVLNMITYSNSSPSSTNSDPSSSRTIAGLIRGGFEFGHFRMSLEYYLVPSTSLYDTNNNLVGKSQNSFLNATLGFYIGGGHWKTSSKDMGKNMMN
jgi:hypothetical protein